MTKPGIGKKNFAPDRFSAYANSLVRSRMRGFERSLPTPMALDLRNYLNSSARGRRTATPSSQRSPVQPYWVLLPMWLRVRFARTGGRRPLADRFIDDVLWAQYCLFQQVRIHDDILDRQEFNPSLIFTANEFRLEADRLLSKYFARSPRFWHIYNTCLSETNRSIIVLRSVQRSRVARPEEILALHAKVCSLFQIGSAAVCVRYNKLEYIPCLRTFADEVAKTGQAIDDLTDVVEDLERGEFNFVSAFILREHRSKMRSTAHALRKILQAMITEDAMSPMFHELRRHLYRARRAIQHLKLEPAVNYLQQRDEQFIRLEEYFHQQRVERVFGKLAHSTQIIHPQKGVSQ